MPRRPRLRARRSRRLGALVLAEQTKPVTPDARHARMLAQGIVGARHRPAAVERSGAAVAQARAVPAPCGRRGVAGPVGRSACAQRGRLACAVLIDRPHAARFRPTTCPTRSTALLPWALRRRLDAEAPTHFTAPSGSHCADRLRGRGGAEGVDPRAGIVRACRHPAIAGGRVPLVIELLSPAHRPVQVTRDLPGFWRGSYAAVKARCAGAIRSIPGRTIRCRRPRPAAPSRAANNTLSFRARANGSARSAAR